MKKLALIVLTGVLAAGVSTAQAEDKAAPDETPKNEVLVAAEAFMTDLDEPSKRHFNVLYGNYNLIKVVETVQGDVGLAVDACGEANPDMKEPLEVRFEEWKTAIKPVLDEADANVNNMILAQDYSKPREIKNFLKKIDKARKSKDKDVEKVPVTSKEACESLLDKMDDTQANMVKLLNMTLVSLPLVMQADDEKAKAEADAKAAEEAAKKAEEEAKQKAKEDAAEAREDEQDL